VLICDLFENAGKALDYSAADDAKADEIAAKVYGTPDEDSQQEMIKPRFEMRKILGTTMVREVTLKPLEK
jgi:ABC-type nitrate/sulfonate/bicarbonate transport system substrate-binding protein